MNEREYILFARNITQESANQLVTVFHTASQTSREIYLLLNCSGGNVQAGIYCYNIMCALQTNLIAHNVGNVDSVANVLFLAANTRVASPSSTFMFHGVAFDVNGPLRLDERYLREHLDSVAADHNRLGNIISLHSKLTIDEIKRHPAGHGIAQGEHQPVGRGVQDEAELVGERALAGGPVGGELALVQLDEVLGLAAGAVDIFMAKKLPSIYQSAMTDWSPQ